MHCNENLKNILILYHILIHNFTMQIHSLNEHLLSVVILVENLLLELINQ